MFRTAKPDNDLDPVSSANELWAKMKTNDSHKRADYTEDGADKSSALEMRLS